MIDIDTEQVTGQIVLVTPEHIELLASDPADAKVPTPVLLVAGIGNWQAAVRAETPGLVVAGLHKPTEWLTVVGAPHKDLGKFIRKDRTTPVTIIFSGSETDAEVFDQVAAISRHLVLIGAASVKVVSLGDFPLEILLEGEGDDAATYLSRLLGTATAPSKRRPAAKKEIAAERPTIAPTVSVDEALIYTGTGNSRAILLEASAQILRTFKTYDDLKDPRGAKAIFTHDLEVSSTVGGTIHRTQVHGVRDQDLANPRVWLNRIPGGTRIIFATDRPTGELIANAIRTHDADLIVDGRVIFRTGWVFEGGEWVFAHPHGAISAAGHTDRIHSQLTQTLSHIDFTTEADVSREQEVEAARNSFAMFRELTIPNLWIGTFGTAMHTVAGLGVGAVPNIVGRAGSGKSTAVAGISAHISHVFRPEKRGGVSMGVVDNSPKNVGKMGVGLDCLFMFIDDMRVRNSQRAKESQEDSIEKVVRPGYAGGHARWAANEYDPLTGKWEAGWADLSSPMLAIVGEVMIDGENSESTKERLYPVNIPTDAKIFASGGSRHYQDLASNGLPTVHLAAFIRWMAQQMQGLGGKDAWTEQWVTIRRSIEDGRSALPVSIRVREVAAVPETGMRVWIKYLLALDVISRSEAIALCTEVTETVSAVALAHGTQNLVSGGVRPWELVIDAFRQSLAHGSAYLEPVGSSWEEGAKVVPENRPMFMKFDDRAICLGYEVKGRGDTGVFIAMLPTVALEVLGKQTRFRGMSERELTAALTEVLITDPGKRFKTVTVSGVKSKTLAIPLEILIPSLVPDQN